MRALPTRMNPAAHCAQFAIDPSGPHIYLFKWSSYIPTNQGYNDELGVALMLFVPPSFLCFHIMFDNVITCRYVCLSGVGVGRTPNGNSTLVGCGPFIPATGLSFRLPLKLLDGNWTLVPFAFRNLHECIWAIALVRIRTVV